MLVKPLKETQRLPSLRDKRNAGVLANEAPRVVLLPLYGRHV